MSITYQLYAATMKLVEYFFSIRNRLIRLIARSIWIQRLTTSLAFLVSAEVFSFISNPTFHWSTWWNFKTTEMKE